MKHGKPMFALFMSALLAVAPLCVLAEATPSEPEKCTHENAVTTVTEENVIYTLVDARTHNKAYDVVTTVDCPDCDEIDSVTSVHRQFSKAHTVENGVCTLCGYKESTPAEPPKKPAPTPTPKPTAAPTPAPTAAPTAEPAPESVVPEMPDMADVLFAAIDLAQLDGEDVTIEIAGMNQIFTAQELEKLEKLPVIEQLMLTLSAVGLADVTETALAAMETTLSDEAQALDAQIVERLLAMTDEEQEALSALLDEYFPLEETLLDGETRIRFTITLNIEEGGVLRVQRYSFLLQEDGAWIFQDCDTQEVKPVG